MIAAPRPLHVPSKSSYVMRAPGIILKFLLLFSLYLLLLLSLLMYERLAKFTDGICKRTPERSIMTCTGFYWNREKTGFLVRQLKITFYMHYPHTFYIFKDEILV